MNKYLIAQKHIKDHLCARVNITTYNQNCVPFVKVVIYKNYRAV